MITEQTFFRFVLLIKIVAIAILTYLCVPAYRYSHKDDIF